jgi:hypothetical protein
MEIRRLEAGDDALVTQVADNVFDEPVRPDRLATYLSQSGHFMVVAIVDGPAEDFTQCRNEWPLSNLSELPSDKAAPTYYVRQNTPLG